MGIEKPSVLKDIAPSKAGQHRSFEKAARTSNSHAGVKSEREETKPGRLKRFFEPMFKSHDRRGADDCLTAEQLQILRKKVLEKETADDIAEELSASLGLAQTI